VEEVEANGSQEVHAELLIALIHVDIICNLVKMY
jgi:hypothetical protein